MQTNDFIQWLRGFTEGVHDFNITPKQWDILKGKLAEVKDDITLPPFPFGTPNTAPNTQSFPTWQQPHYVDPYNPYKITCTPGTTITTTPGTSGHITIGDVPSITFSSGSGLGVGTTYTTNGAPNWYTTYFADLNDKTND